VQSHRHPPLSLHAGHGPWRRRCRYATKQRSDMVKNGIHVRRLYTRLVSTIKNL
jgi:hypothetical protein